MNAASWLEALPAHDRWRTLLTKEGPRIATVALGLALCAQLAFIVTDPALWGRAGAKARVPQASLWPQHTLDLAAITNAHLFGAAPVAPRDGANAPQTNIRLVLTGTIAGNDPQN